MNGETYFYMGLHPAPIQANSSPSSVGVHIFILVYILNNLLQT